MFRLLILVWLSLSATAWAEPMHFEIFRPCTAANALCAPRILAIGMIEKDSHLKLAAFLAQHTDPDTPLASLPGMSDMRTRQHMPPDGPPLPAQATLCFHSAGGDMRGAVELGLLLRKRQIDTCLAPAYPRVTPAGLPMPLVEQAHCLSACAFAFAGGVHRHIAEGSRLGVHQFRSAQGDAGESMTQIAMVLLAAYLEQMGVSRTLLDAAALVPPNKLYMLTLEEAQHLRMDNTATNSVP